MSGSWHSEHLRMNRLSVHRIWVDGSNLRGFAVDGFGVA